MNKEEGENINAKRKRSDADTENGIRIGILSSFFCLLCCVCSAEYLFAIGCRFLDALTIPQSPKL